MPSKSSGARGSGDGTEVDLAVVEAELRAQGFVDDAALAWAASVGAVQQLIRRSFLAVWEDWHSQPWGLSDAEMMRANVAMTRLVHDAFTFEGTAWTTVAEQLVDPGRLLPDGRTLRQYAGRRVPALRRDVITAGQALDALQNERGPRATALALVGLTRIYGGNWYGMPSWPDHVAVFCTAIDDPAHRHWTVAGQYAGLPERPDQIKDTERLRELLLDGPDHLDADSASWCIRAALPYVLVNPPDNR